MSPEQGRNRQHQYYFLRVTQCDFSIVLFAQTYCLQANLKVQVLNCNYTFVHLWCSAQFAVTSSQTLSRLLKYLHKPFGGLIKVWWFSLLGSKHQLKSCIVSDLLGWMLLLAEQPDSGVVQGWVQVTESDFQH